MVVRILFYHWYEFNCAVNLHLLYAILGWNDPSRGESRTKENSHKWPRARERQVSIIVYITKENTIALSNYVEVICNTVFHLNGMAWWKIALRNIVSDPKNHVAYTLTKSCGFRV